MVCINMGEGKMEKRARIIRFFIVLLLTGYVVSYSWGGENISNSACKRAKEMLAAPNTYSNMESEDGGYTTHPEALMLQLVHCSINNKKKAKIVKRLFLDYGAKSWGFHGAGGDCYWMAAVGWLDCSKISPEQKEILLKEFLAASSEKPSRQYFINVALGNICAERGQKTEAIAYYAAAHALENAGQVSEKPFYNSQDYYIPVNFLSVGTWEEDGRPLAPVRLTYLWKRFIPE